MKPHTCTAQTAEMFRPRLDEQLNMKHPLIRLAGLLCLQHANDASDEMVVNTWLESPCWQFFTGETCPQTELPIDPPRLATQVGRVQRDVQRQLAKLPEQVQAKGQDLLQHPRVSRHLFK